MRHDVDVYTRVFGSQVVHHKRTLQDARKGYKCATTSMLDAGQRGATNLATMPDCYSHPTGYGLSRLIKFMWQRLRLFTSSRVFSGEGCRSSNQKGEVIILYGLGELSGSVICCPPLVFPRSPSFAFSCCRRAVHMDFCDKE